MNAKQKLFADYYIQTGNAVESAIKAGYSVNYANAQSYKLLDIVGDYIKEQNKALESNRIADMKEVKEFWTDILRNNDVEFKDRLKASEFIAKTNGAFIDKIEHSGSINNEVEIIIGAENIED
jgi:phage terminase small subunit